MAEREAFLKRTLPGSAARAVDEECLARFDKAGLGNHPTFLAMLEALASDAPNTNYRAAKKKAYKLFNETTAANTAKQADDATRSQQDARRFFQELLDSVETLSGIADVHGSQTLADLMYLQNAILSGGFVDHYPEESHALEIASGLPSGKEWAGYIEVEYLLGAMA